MTRPQCRECARGAVDSAAHDRVVHATRTWEYPSEGLDASEITAAVIEPAERDSGAMARQPLRAEGSEHQAVSSPGGTGHEKWWSPELGRRTRPSCSPRAPEKWVAAGGQNKENVITHSELRVEENELCSHALECGQELVATAAADTGWHAANGSWS